MKSAEREYRQLILDYLDRLREPLLAKLSTLVRRKPPRGVEVLSFEVHDFPYEEFGVHAYAMSKGGSEVYFKPPFSGPVLRRGRAPKFPPDELGRFEDAGVHTNSAGGRLLAEWFGERWSEAGGDEFPLPAFIGLHDDLTVYSLRKKKWVSAGAQWK